MIWHFYKDKLLWTLIILALFLFLMNLGIGEITIVWSDLWVEDSNLSKKIVFNHRLPESIAAVLTGICLPISGWVLQEFFKNPLAGPSILGISTASALAVSTMVIFGSSLGFTYLLNAPTLNLLASLLGSIVLVGLLLIASYKATSSSALIIIGFMFSTICGAGISLLEFWSESRQLKEVLIWSMGSLQGLSWTEILLYFAGTLVGLILVIRLLPLLTKMQLGDDYGQSYGVNLKTYRRLCILSASVLAATATAFVGPIIFIGLAVPHICRSLLKTANFYKLFTYVLIVGIIFLELIAILPDLFDVATLPINIITSLIGAPIVMSIVLNQRKNFI